MKSAMPLCLLCSNPLGPDDKACSRCGAVYTPDAHAAEQQMSEDVKDSWRETELRDADRVDKLAEIDTLLDDPVVREILYKKLENKER